MSERRQLALLLAGLVALVAIGFGGALLFPEGCSGLDQLGTLELTFQDAGDALGVDDDAEAELHDLGSSLGGRDWRGAVALPADAEVLASRFGFFVVTPTDVTVLRPSIGLASAARGRVGLDVFAAGEDVGLRGPDGETAILDSEYDLARCGTLPPASTVLDVDRGFAAVAGDDADVVLRTLSGDTVWRVADAADADVLGDVTVVWGRGPVRLVDTRTGTELDRAGGSTAEVLAADSDGLLVADAGELLDVPVATDGLGAPVLLASGLEPSPAAVRTRTGVLALGVPGPVGPALTVIDGGSTAGTVVPAAVVGLLVSEDDHVGLVVSVGVSRALLVYAPAGA